MSDTDGRKPLGLGGGARSGQVKQSFSHGRTKSVLVETKRKRVVVAKPGAAKPSSGDQPGFRSTVAFTSTGRPSAPTLSPKAGLSGQMPLSMMPRMTSSPFTLRDWPSSIEYTPPGAVRPRNSVVRVVSSWRASDGTTDSTSGLCINLAASAAVICAAKPLKVTL